jgi:hypothetical protein
MRPTKGGSRRVTRFTTGRERLTRVQRKVLLALERGPAGRDALDARLEALNEDDGHCEDRFSFRTRDALKRRGLLTWEVADNRAVYRLAESERSAPAGAEAPSGPEADRDRRLTPPERAMLTVLEHCGGPAWRRDEATAEAEGRSPGGEAPSEDGAEPWLAVEAGREAGV